MTSSDGGRRGWQGLRFEAAFAALNLVRVARGQPPLGPDDRTAIRAEELRDSDVRFLPQADGAVDDLVGLRLQRREVAYQLKSGLAQLPRSASSASETAAAFRQAGRELRDPSGARVVSLVFGRLSSKMRILASWFAGDDGILIDAGALDVLAEVMGFDRSVEWATLRPRIRVIGQGSAADLGALVDAELTACYSSPADRLAASDAIRELVAVHSDTDGASLPPIDRQRLADWLHARGLRPLTIAERNADSAPILLRACRRYLQSVEKSRGGLPAILRAALVEKVNLQLTSEDVVLLGGGGAGKTELEAQLVRQHLEQGWQPVVLRREDLSHSGNNLGRAVGAGGRTDLTELTTQLLSNKAEKVLLVIDGLDEIRRIAGSEQADLAVSLRGVLDEIRTSHPDRSRLHILLSCRRFDWKRLASSGWSVFFAEIEVPPIDAEELLAIPSSEESLLSFVDSLDGPVRGIALSRPILLRMAYELWTLRNPDRTPSLTPILSDVTTEVGLWRTYYDECVCGVDSGLVASLSPGHVMKCHDEMARRHLDAGVFSLSVPAPAIEMNHPRAFSWLRSVEVAVTDQVARTLHTRFFHPSYGDFALALAASTDRATRQLWAHSTELSISLYPVWRRLPTLWADPANARASLCELIEDENVPQLTKRALLEGYMETGPDDQNLRRVAIATVETGNERAICDFIDLAAEQSQSLPSGSEAWMDELAKAASTLDVVSLDRLLITATKLLANVSTETLKPIVRGLAQTGFERARTEGRLPGGFNNARALARHSAELLSHALDLESIANLPLTVDDWLPLGNRTEAAIIAADLRLTMTDRTVLEDMHLVDAEATLRVLVRLLGDPLPARDGQAQVGTPMQTSAVNMTMSLHNLWEGAWYATGATLPSLLAKDKRYLQLSILAWQIVGHSNQRDNAEGSFPREDPADFWLHDRSYSWWRAGFQTPTAHLQIANAGFHYVEQQALQDQTSIFHYLCAIAEEVRWAGLAAIVLDISSKVLKATSQTESSPIAEAAAKLISHPRALKMLEIREAAIAALPSIAAHTTGTVRERLWAAIRELADVKRIANDQPRAPAPERERATHANLMAKFKAELDVLPDDGERSSERAGITLKIDMLV